MVILGAFMLMQLLGAIILARMQIAIRSDETLKAEFLDGDSSSDEEEEVGGTQRALLAHGTTAHGPRPTAHGKRCTVHGAWCMVHNTRQLF